MNKTTVAALASTVVVLVSVGLGGVASAMDKAVTVNIDGENRPIHVWGTTVHDVLTDQNIVLGEYDEVFPAADEPISDGTVIEVNYGRQVTIIIDGVEKTFWTTATTLEEALTEIGLHDSDARFSVDRSMPLGRDGITVSATTPKEVTIKADGRDVKVTSTAADVAGLLAENGITFDGDDRVSQSLSSRLTAGMTISVQRIEVSEVTENTTIPHETKTTDDDSLPKGTTKVIVEGKDGEKQVVYQIVWADGVEESKNPISETVITEPVTEEVKAGTKDDPGSGPPGTPSPSTGGSTRYSGSHADWMTAAGIDPADFSAVEILVSRESTWNPNAVNASSGACGLVQALPCAKLGPNWNDPVVALKWGDQYVKERYGGWQQALAHSYAYGWY